MNRSVVAVLGVADAVVVGGAVWFFTQGDAEPTTEVTAPPIADSETTQAASPETTAAEVDAGPADRGRVHSGQAAGAGRDDRRNEAGLRQSGRVVDLPHDVQDELDQRAKEGLDRQEPPRELDDG